ncbi:hypothetical protein, partial [Yersinia aldovae]|uniref:hypothetical protein n=1 Tax=Yersinia aldovae TaxID=29483 RepID=UPI001C984B7F
ERSAVKVARSVLRRAQSGNWLCLSDYLFNNQINTFVTPNQENRLCTLLSVGLSPAEQFYLLAA